MTRFPAQWLTLREPLDREAQAPDVDAALVAWRLRSRSGLPLRILDIGSGTGSSARRIGSHLAGPLHWRFVDNDPELLAIAAETFENMGAAQASIHQVDLAIADIGGLFEGIDLVTASALLDLVSEAWFRRLWRIIEDRETPLLATLNYDGRIALHPPHDLDTVIRDRFNRHQRRDKRFGPALGPRAAAVAVDIARNSGWTVTVRRSDWLLSAARNRPALDMLITGWAKAVREQAPTLDTRVSGWLEKRLADPALKVRVGHRDILALPGSQSITRLA